MGEIKVPGLSEADLAQVQREADRLGLSLEAYVRLKLLSGTDRGATAREIRARQSRMAAQDSAEIVRSDRDTR
jgi:hypothetical protein